MFDPGGAARRRAPWPPHETRGRRVPLLALAAVLVTACGTSADGNPVGPGDARSQRTQAATPYPALLAARHRLPPAEAAFVERVPSAVRPARASVVRVPAPADAVGRYWLAPWRTPPRPGRWFCLYSAGPGDAGPATQCFDSPTYRQGRAYALSARRGRVELVGFNPDPRGSVALRYADRTVPLPVRQNVFVASSTARPERLEVRAFGRRMVLPVGLPADLP